MNGPVIPSHSPMMETVYLSVPQKVTLGVQMRDLPVFTNTRKVVGLKLVAISSVMQLVINLGGQFPFPKMVHM